jgi:hypothetical protein
MASYYFKIVDCSIKAIIGFFVYKFLLLLKILTKISDEIILFLKGESCANLINFFIRFLFLSVYVHHELSGHEHAAWALGSACVCSRVHGARNAVGVTQLV